MTIRTISESWTEVGLDLAGSSPRPAGAAGFPGSSASLPSRRAQGPRRRQVSSHPVNETGQPWASWSGRASASPLLPRVLC